MTFNLSLTGMDLVKCSPGKWIKIFFPYIPKALPKKTEGASLTLFKARAQRGDRGRLSNTGLKVGTHEGAYSRSTLLQHAPGAKLPLLHQRFLAKKYVAQQNFCSRVLLSRIKLVWYEGASSRGKSVARVCFRSKLPRVYWNLLAVTWRVSSLPIKLAYFFHPQQFPCPNRVVLSFSSLIVSFVCTGWGTYPGACVGSVFQEQAPSCVTLKRLRTNSD